MQGLIKRYNDIAECLRVQKLVSLAQNITLLTTRLWIANIFFKSGLTKIASWEQTLILFEYEYEVPLLPVNVAAFLATASELVFPILLALGILSRISVLPLFLMTLVIEFLIISNAEHYYWLLMMLTIISFGGGKLSLDNFIARKTNLVQIK